MLFNRLETIKEWVTPCNFNYRILALKIVALLKYNQ